MGGKRTTGMVGQSGWWWWCALGIVFLWWQECLWHWQVCGQE